MGMWVRRRYEVGSKEVHVGRYREIGQLSALSIDSVNGCVTAAETVTKHS